MNKLSKYTNALAVLRLYPALLTLYLLCSIVSAIIISTFFSAVMITAVIDESPVLSITVIAAFITLNLGFFILYPFLFGKIAMKRYKADIVFAAKIDCDREKALKKLRKIYKNGRNSVHAAPIAVLMSMLLLKEDKAEEAAKMLSIHYKNYSCASDANKEIFTTICGAYIPALMRLDRNGEAKSVYDRMLSLCENDAGLMGTFGKNLTSTERTLNIKNGIFDGAEEFYKKEIEINGTPASIYMLAQVYMLQGRKEEAAPLFREAAEKTDDKYIKRKSEEYLSL